MCGRAGTAGQHRRFGLSVLGSPQIRPQSSQLVKWKVAGLARQAREQVSCCLPKWLQPLLLNVKSTLAMQGPFLPSGYKRGQDPNALN